MTRILHMGVYTAAFTVFATAALAAPYSVVEKPAMQISADLAAHKVSSVALVRTYEARIRRINPEIHAVIGVVRTAGAQARESDARRAHGESKGPLDGLPIIVKDNIGIAGEPTTAGSLALIDNARAANAPTIENLAKAGAVIFARANLSEWANIRSTHAISGWSAVGGLTRNPYMLDRTACGSSSGSAAAVAASLAAAAVGTETDGSITCPAAVNGLVGLKPTVGLISRTGVVPISQSQDTPGPITHTVEDAAALLTAMAGSDPADPATAEADAHRTDYVKGLDRNALKGARIGVIRAGLDNYTPQTVAVFEKALDDLKAQGAVLVDIDKFDMGKIPDDELTVLMTELKADMALYLAGSPPAVQARTLADLIAFDKVEPRETKWFGQELFEKAEATKGLDDPDYIKARDEARKLAGPDGIDKLLADNNVIALVAPTMGPAWVIDVVNGDPGSVASDTTLPAVAGYPHLTVPMGEVSGLPVGISFVGPKWSEQLLLSLGYAYEQATHAHRPPTYAANIQTQD